MRRLLMAAAILGAVQSAHAADLPDLPVLRGAFPEGLTSSKANWQGYYIGGQAGYGSSDENFAGSTSTMIARLLNNTIIESQMGISQWPQGLGKVSGRAPGFGGFVGYNSQWDDVIVGVEASYLHGSYGGTSSGIQRRIATLSDGFAHDVTAKSTASIAIHDTLTLRARAGYEFGCFLPYMFAGFALGNADITRAAAISDSPTWASTSPQTVFLPSFTPSASEIQHGHLLYGYSAGLGVDVNLIASLFLRAEWEYIRFAGTIDTSINTGRVGLGYKF